MFNQRHNPGIRDLCVLLFLFVTCLASLSFQWPWDNDEPWPSSSNLPVLPLPHPSLETRESKMASRPDQGFSFAAYGDQRALAKGGWQTLVAKVAELDAVDPLLFVIDTGDVVHKGEHTDQFNMLATILQPIRHLPYWIAVGNHEICNNKVPETRGYVARLMQRTDRTLSSERLFYRKDVGAVTFLFLDSNDIVYGESGLEGEGFAYPFSPRVQKQWLWLTEQLQSLDPNRTVVVSMHHPFVQSSKKHADDAQLLWSFGTPDTSLPELLIKHGVDLVLVGHTHTYERFLVERDGREMQVVNVSGRPRDAVFWYGSGLRSSRSLAGREHKWLAKKGWDLDGWTITQQFRMDRKEKNQFAHFRVDAGGALTMRVAFVDDDLDEEVFWGDEAKIAVH